VHPLSTLRAELLAAEYVLNTDFSFDLAEPHYRRCLALIHSEQKLRREFVALMTSMFETNELGDEPVAYLMHCPRWREVLTWAEDNLRTMEHPILHGRPLANICEAFDDRWQNRKFYTFKDR
jgi:hypothetical protein